jgi:hypothetical protein
LLSFPIPPLPPPPTSTAKTCETGNESPVVVVVYVLRSVKPRGIAVGSGVGLDALDGAGNTDVAILDLLCFFY